MGKSGGLLWAGEPELAMLVGSIIIFLSYFLSFFSCAFYNLFKTTPK
jgi:hypothetical protein